MPDSYWVVFHNELPCPPLMSSYHLFLPPSLSGWAQGRMSLDWKRAMHVHPLSNEQSKANGPWGSKSPGGTDHAGFLCKFTIFCDPYCFQSKYSHQTGEGMIEQNIHYHSFWKWRFENSVKNYKHIKKQSTTIILYAVYLRNYQWCPLPPIPQGILCFYTGCPLFKRSSLKRSFLSRSWITASFDPWISSSDAILAVLPVFLGNPLQNSTKKKKNHELSWSHSYLGMYLESLLLMKKTTLCLWK